MSRLVERLRSLPLARLAAAIEPGAASRGDLARDLAQHLADVAAAIEGRPVRAIPRLSDEYAGDQVAVTARDLAAAVGHGGALGGGGDGVHDDIANRLADCIARVRELRLAL